MRFRYYSEGTQKPVYLYKYYEEGTVHTLDISEIGYATLFLGFNAEIPANVEAYIATSTENDRVQLTQVEGVLPAETGVIVKATAGSYDFFRSEEETTDVTGNLFKGSAESTVISKEANKSYYILANGNNGIGFYKPVNGDDTTQFTNGANKAYLEVEGADRSASFYGFNFDGTTAIEGVEVENVEKVIYDLTGRRVKEIAAPGIYIVNGKKVLVK
jgi:glucuronoarabinoxylan endo-1,4-beta-xylanase